MSQKITVRDQEIPEIQWPSKLFEILEEYSLKVGSWTLLDDETLELLVGLSDVFANENEVWVVELKNGVYNLYVPDEAFWIEWDKRFEALTAQCAY